MPLFCGSKTGIAVAPSSDPIMTIVTAIRDANVQKKRRLWAMSPGGLREFISCNFRASTSVGIDLWRGRTVDRVVAGRWEKLAEEHRTGRRIVGTGRTSWWFYRPEAVPSEHGQACGCQPWK